MIVLTHKHNRVVSVFNYEDNSVIQSPDIKPSKALFQLAAQYPNRLIAWCHDDLKDCINQKGFQSIFHHPLIMASYELRTNNYISERIGYVESTPFVNINKNVTYPTWLMSSFIGAIHAQVLLKFDPNIYKYSELDYTLNSIAKKGMVNGLFCYSTPELLTANKILLAPHISSSNTLYKFIKQHYRSRWTFITFFNSLIYEKKFHFFPLIRSFFVSKKPIVLNLRSIEIATPRTIPSKQTIDVIIPTMGRKAYLYDVLKDLSIQTHLPKQVIVIEQNSDPKSTSDLHYLQKDSWPFFIEHTFTHQTGACNARNMALEKVSSDWVFFADDDIRFQSQLLEEALQTITKYGLKAATLSCLLDGEIETRKNNMQWHTFGSGCSFVTSNVLKNISYNLAFEHGFGEDGDFGMQIRNRGTDIGYLPHCNILHLKAQLGGFRTSVEHPWIHETIQPKPSPTIMLFNLKHRSKIQLLGYKTILFFKFFKLQSHKNIISYFSLMKKQWNQSVFWANQLQSRN